MTSCERCDQGDHDLCALQDLEYRCCCGRRPFSRRELERVDL